MILKQGTFMEKHMIKNTYNNVSGLQEVLEEDYGYEMISEILDDLEYAFNEDDKDYLMNIVGEMPLTELIEISKNYNILTDSYPLGKYKKIGI